MRAPNSQEFSQQLIDLGLVLVKLAPNQLGGGWKWWIPKARAEELVKAGEAEYEPTSGSSRTSGGFSRPKGGS
jgi:hypothetical protein